MSIRGNPRQLVHLFAVDKEPWHVIVDQPDERCVWLHLERSPKDDEQIALPKVTLSELEEALWQLLAEKDDVGLYEPTMALNHRKPFSKPVLMKAHPESNDEARIRSHSHSGLWGNGEAPVFRHLFTFTFN